MKKVFIADRINQMLDFRLFPEGEGVDLVTAYSNDHMLTMHGKYPGDLMITELYGAGMNGVELCSRIRETPGLRAVSIVLYCRSNQIEINEGIRSRANMVLTLPLERMPLLQAVHRLLDIPVRRSCCLEITARTADRSASPFMIRTADISATGMLIETDAALLPGEILHCTFSLPPALPVRFPAEVVRKAWAPGRTRYGIRFLQLDRSALKAIEKLVA